VMTFKRRDCAPVLGSVAGAGTSLCTSDIRAVSFVERPRNGR
jgi:hypothetical protein